MDKENFNEYRNNMDKENFNEYIYENTFIHTLPYPLTALVVGSFEVLCFSDKWAQSVFCFWRD
jgi:hypothetical protein